MRKVVYLLLILVVLSISVSADILWEPYENAYYMENYEEATYIDAKYEVPEGMTVNIYTKPNGDVIKTLEAGTVVYIGPSLEVDGELWATGYPLWDYDTDGWMRLSRLQKRYCHEDFVKDFAGNISSGGEIEVSDIDSTIYTWTYPGSGVSDGTLERELFISGADYNDGMLSYSLVYTDPNGGKWGYIGYYMGHCGWMYLDDPGNAEPSYVLDVQPVSTVTDTRPTEDATTQNHIGLTIPLLIGAVIIVTAILIIVLKKKK